MKRYGDLWPTLISFENLYLAYRKAIRGKRLRPDVAHFIVNAESELLTLQEELQAKRYLPGPYRTFYVYEDKPRMISAAPFRDRVVHHALCNLLEPIFERSFIPDLYSNRVGKGQHQAVKRAQYFARSCPYVLKCDIKKYFPSIDHEILKTLVRKKIKCRDTLWLVEVILDHSNPQEPVQNYFPQDDLLTALERRKGLPIGNQTSQFFANLYLSPLDHFVKETLRIQRNTTANGEMEQMDIQSFDMLVRNQIIPNAHLVGVFCGIAAFGPHISTIHFSIRAKIFFIILIPSLLLLLIIAMDYHNLTRLGQSAELILSKNYKSIQAAQKIRQHVEMTRNQILLSIFKSETIDTAITPPNQEIAELLEVCRNNITEPGEPPIIAGLFKKYTTYQHLLDNMARYPANAPPLNVAYLDFISLTAEIVDDIHALVGINEQAMERAERETKDFARQALRYSISLMIVALVAAIILSYLLSRRISSPLTTLAKTLSTIQEGSGSYPEFPVKTQDEIGFLTSEFNRLFTRLKEYDRESADKLLAEKEKVHQAEIAKAQFIADLSHQLKTPMTSLNMGIGILVENPGSLSSTKQKKLIETAKDDCTRLSALINELVDIARLEAMVKPREHEVLDIERVIQECLKPLVHQAEQKQVTIEVSVESGIPPISLDSLRFPWVITNLIGNAIRYTNPGGKVTFHVHTQAERLYFQCQDTGIGIEEKYLSKIFQRYSQFSEREKSGTIGLGLAIVKEIVEQHGGSISVQSQVQQGTTFTFWIPLNIKDTHHEERPDY